MNIELVINGAKGSFMPILCGKVVLTSQLWGAGCLKFNVLKEGSIDFKEGDRVSLVVDNKNMFYGYVFSKSRTKQGVISVTCYDQMRYLKNKDTYTFVGLSASQIFTKIATDYRINTGTIEQSGYVLPPTIEDNSTLMDILFNAVYSTWRNGYGDFIIYDDYGKLCFKNTKNMQSNLIADKDTVIDFNYKTTIDKGVYNKVKLIYKRETKNTSVLNIFNAQDDESIKKWGVLQYFAHIDINKVDGNAMASEILSQSKTKNRELTLITFGNVNIRAGWRVNVNLDIGDFVVNEAMKIKRCSHIFEGNDYEMELELVGGVLDE